MRHINTMFLTKNKKIKYSVIFLLVLLFYYFMIYIPKCYDYNEEIKELYQIKMVNFLSNIYLRDESKKNGYKERLDEIKDEKIKKIFSEINYKNNISIRKERETGEIYVYTTLDRHHHNMKIYDVDGITLKDEFSFYTPYYATMGVFDKKNHQMYMQIYEKHWFGFTYEGNAKINIFVEYMLNKYLKEENKK